MVILVYSHVDERRHQHGHAEQQIPRGFKTSQSALLYMANLMQEAHPAIQSQHRDGGGREHRRGKGPRSQGYGKGSPADSRAQQHVGPENPRVGRMQIAD